MEAYWNWHKPYLIALLCYVSFSHTKADYSYETQFYKVALDHFSFTINETLSIRVLVNTTFWNKEKSKPIFIYTGNEGHIESFANNTGFMWEIAEEFEAAVVFAEHRFYGKSVPSNSLKEEVLKSHGTDILGYLSVQQVLADFAEILTSFKQKYNAPLSPVIAFGGSYGGVLTAYLRMKYPHIVQGGIAASAPFYLQNVPCNTHDKILMKVYEMSGENCVNTIKKSWNILRQLGDSSKGRKWLMKYWKICDYLEHDFKNADSIINWLESMYSLMGMANYPYPANFLQDLPANPVDKFCNFLNQTDVENQKEVVTDLYRAMQVYINNTGTTYCFDFSNKSMYSVTYTANDDTAFDYQSCTELVDPECDDGVTDFFEPSDWDFESFSQYCYDSYKVRPQPELVDLFYGGRNLLGSSNIVFSNGLLDPWHGYGVLSNLSDSLIALVMPDAAHHLDLRASNPADPPSVIQTRKIEIRLIRKWIAEYKQQQLILANDNLII